MSTLRFSVIGDPAPLPKHIAKAFTVEPNGCWLWKQSLSRDGYGWTSYRNKTYQAHRFVYAWAVGLIPDGLVIDHLCRVRHCVNPKHMELVTNDENLKRGVGPSGMTLCARGHGLSRLRGQRRCLICLVAYEASRLERKRVQERDRRARLKAAL